MTQEKLSAAERIDRALDRIEHAIADRRAAHDAIARRHATLRARMGDAVEALDRVLSDARG